MENQALEVRLCQAIKADDDATIQEIIHLKEFVDMVQEQRLHSSGFPGGNMHTVLIVEKKKFQFLDPMMAKGDKLVEPHVHGCLCKYCRQAEQPIDSITYWNIAIRVYMVILHDEYLSRELSHCYKDNPMKRLLELYTTTKHLKHDNRLVRDGMSILKDITTSYPTLLLNSAKSYREVALVLSQGSTDDDDKFRLVEGAYRHHLKALVMQPKCQILIDNEWYGLFMHNRLVPKSAVLKLALGCTGLIILPPIYILIALLWTLGLTSLLEKKLWYEISIMELIRTPVVGFYAYLYSYLIFFLTISSWVIEFGDNKGLDEARPYNEILKESKQSLWTADCFSNNYYNQNITNNLYTNDTIIRQLSCRDDGLDALVVLQSVWIGAILFRELSEAITKPIVYVKDTGNYVDLVSGAFYAATIAIYFQQLSKTRQAREWFDAAAASATQVSIEGNIKPAFTSVLRDELQDRSKHLYWLNSNRLFWFYFDPAFVGQVLHGVGTAALFLRFLSIALEFPGVGPLYTALYRMAEKAMSFIVLQAILIVVFGVSIRTVGYGYTTLAFNENFGSYLSALNSLYWAMFGQTDGTLAAYFTKDKLSMTEAPQREMIRASTTFGTFILAVYYLLMTVFILNMLIAFLTSLYQEEDKGKDREWRWLKVRQRLEFLQSGRRSLSGVQLLPPPLNVLTTLRKWLIETLRLCFRCKRKAMAVKSYTSYEKLERRSQMSQDDYKWPEGGILSSVYNWEEDYWNPKKKKDKGDKDKGEKDKGDKAKSDKPGKLIVRFLRQAYGLEGQKSSKKEDAVKSGQVPSTAISAQELGQKGYRTRQGYQASIGKDSDTSFFTT